MLVKDVVPYLIFGTIRNTTSTTMPIDHLT